MEPALRQLTGSTAEPVRHTGALVIGPTAGARYPTRRQRLVLLGTDATLTGVDVTANVFTTTNTGSYTNAAPHTRHTL